jgi:hypothetical protein
MSNPAVITLCSVNLAKNVNFRIEDNIGECIHIHYANFRFDFTVDEFLKLENLIIESLNNSFEVDEFELTDFDINFLASIADNLEDLESIKKEKISLRELKVFNYKKGIPILVGLEKSMMLKALKGNTKEYEEYKQENFFEESNISRLFRVKEYVENSESLQPIILFNNQNFIRDGQHRSAILLGNKKEEILALRMFFRKNRHNISVTPILDYFVKWDIERLKSVYRYIRSTYINVKKRLSSKLPKFRSKLSGIFIWIF